MYPEPLLSALDRDDAWFLGTGLSTGEVARSAMAIGGRCGVRGSARRLTVTAL